ncbi:MAG: hypothetical protein HY909_21885 [Deltaproteobacteria bacterium]|nr:hypothetical protein [Deltaproteobacteria bacterium]
MTNPLPGEYNHPPTVMRGRVPRVFLALLLTACASGRAPPARSPDGDPLAQVPPAQLYATGVALARGGDLIRAEQYLALCLRRGLPDRRVLLTLLQVCVAASRYSAAVSYAEPYLEQHPDDWALRYLTATIQDGLGDRVGARRQLERVLELHEAHADAHYLLARLMTAGDDRELPRSHLRRYLELNPDGPHADEVRAELLRSPPP